MGKNTIPSLGDPVPLGEFLMQDLMRSGVYFLFDRGMIVYVGQTKTIKWRLDCHISEGRKVFDAVAFIPCTIDRLFDIEGHYIRKFVPKYNDCQIARQARQHKQWGIGPERRVQVSRQVDAPCGNVGTEEVAAILGIEKSEVERIASEDLGYKVKRVGKSRKRARVFRLRDVVAYQAQLAA